MKNDEQFDKFHYLTNYDPLESLQDHPLFIGSTHDIPE